MSTFPNRRWLVIPTSATGSIDFNQVLESSPSSLRLSVDGTKTFVKYEINEVLESYVVTVPATPSIEDPTVMSEERTYTVEAGIYGRPSIYSDSYPEYNHEDILALLATEEWSKPITEDKLT
jgi:hypothetical protein